VGRSDIEAKLLDQPRQSRRLAFGQLQHEPCESRRVDDRVLQRALQPAANQPGVEGIMAVLDQDGALGETKESTACVTKFGRPDQHRPVDVVPFLSGGIYWRTAIDEGVEKRKGA
jgi:hypothetical protein